jgi:hypothetical protein
VVVPIFTSLRIRTVKSLGIARWASLTVWTSEPSGHPRCRVGIVSLGLALLADELACADRNDQRVDTWVHQRSLKHGLKITLTAHGVVRHEQGPWRQPGDDRLVARGIDLFLSRRANILHALVL